MNEIWKDLDIDNYDKYYQISNLGNVKSKITGITCKQHTRNGYLSTCLYNYENKKKRTMSIHRLVAKVFIENPNDHNVVNHLDGNKHNNRATNLEWTSAKGNYRHAIKNGLFKPHSKKVEQYTKNGQLLATFDSIKEASRKTGANDRQISCVCKGKRKTSGGFIWKYANDHCNIHEEVDLSTLEKVKGYEHYYVNKDGRIYTKNIYNPRLEKVVIHLLNYIKIIKVRTTQFTD